MAKSESDGKKADFLDLVKGRRLREPPEHVVRRASALGADLPRGVSAAGWIVRLVFDSLARPVPVGVRAAGADERRLLFSLESGDVATSQLDLRIRDAEGRTVELTGQLLPPWPNTTVRIESEERSRRQPLGAGGEFRFEKVPAGRRIRISLEQETGGEPVVVDVTLNGSGS